ncbi:transcription-repair coupling factor [Pseudomonas syringae pv. actinidiae]|nr:transcription-repair coupling factor [Pseudomonas syringae pv. actinidiae]
MSIKFIERCFGSARSLAVSLQMRSGAATLVLVPNNCDLDTFAEELAFYAGVSPEHVLVFPDLETLPYDLESPSNYILDKRAKVFSQLVDITEPLIIVTNVNAVMMRVAGPSHWHDTHVTIEKGQKIDVYALEKSLEKIGYVRQPIVHMPGEFCIHPNVIDIVALGPFDSVRVRTKNGYIDRISRLDVRTQRSGDDIGAVLCMPARENPASAESIRCFRTKFRQTFDQGYGQPIYEDVSKGIFPIGIEYYLPLFEEKPSTLFDYLPSDFKVFVVDSAFEEISRHWKSINRRYQDLQHDHKRLILEPSVVWLTDDDLLSILAEHDSFYVGAGEVQNADFDLGCVQHSVTRQDDTKQTVEMLKQWASDARVIVVSLSSQVKKDQVRMLALMAGRQFKEAASWSVISESAVSKPTLFVIYGHIEEGFYQPESSLLHITEKEIFGYSTFEKTGDVEDDDSLDPNDFMGIQEGERLVHLKYGIGEFKGTENLDTNSVGREYLKIGYAESANTYVRMEDLDLVSPYGAIEDKIRPLDVMGTESWLSDLKDASRGIGTTAATLLHIQRERKLMRGLVMDKPSAKYLQFANEFPFDETKDQKRAIRAIEQDLMSVQPMDRLIIGDVGFGKTEIAARAAFFTAVSGYQVAILVPTTLLASQHYEHFKTRFASFPDIQIDMLSSFSENPRRVLEGVKSGRTRIIIGTHALLEEGVKYPSLGLIIIDEEHRFGVAQKSKLSAMRANVNLLSMTATPIPRTLSMSLMGIRDVSNLETPPAKRLSVRTYVSDYDEGMICEAIDREMQRSGQAFFVHNNTSTIEARTQELQALMPEVRFEFAHGKMKEGEMEKIMKRYYSRQFDVLVCTTIIEIGIDVPNANTIIMERADRMGIAQMHQLRGRVGRSARQAYCYLLKPAGEEISEDAEKRLNAMVAASKLGSGSVLANHDLEIRGAGEILGEDQSGHIMAIGYALYVRLLERAVEMVEKGREVTYESLVGDKLSLDVNLSGFIPSGFIADETVRLSIYNRIANITKEEQLDKLIGEIEDRFGDLPEETANLLISAQLRLHMRRIGIENMIVDDEGGRVQISQNAALNPGSLIDYCEANSSKARMDSPYSMRFYHSTVTRNDRIDLVMNIMDTLLNFETTEVELVS